MSHYTSLTSVFLTPAPQVLCAGARLHQIVTGSQQEIHGLAFASWKASCRFCACIGTMNLRKTVVRGVLTAPRPGGLRTARPTLRFMERERAPPKIGRELRP